MIGTVTAVECRRPAGPWRTPLQHQEHVLSLAVSPDGKTIVTGSGPRTGSDRLTATGAALERGNLPAHRASAVASRPT